MIPVRHIFLIGVSGSGKTTVGKELAKKLKWPFIDVDRLVERKARLKIVDIFDGQGEPTFRRMESNAIKELALKGKKNAVIVLGGGAFENKSTRDWILLTGVSIWLKCSIKELTKRLMEQSDRPLLLKKAQTPYSSKNELGKKIRNLLDRRKNNYKRAEFSISTTDKTPEKVAAEIEDKIMSKYA